MGVSLQLWTPVGRIISDTMQNFVLFSFLAVATSASVVPANPGVATTYIGQGNNVQISAFGNELASGYEVIQAHPGGRSTQYVSLSHAGHVLPYSSGYGKRSVPTTYIGNGNNVQVSAFGNELASGYDVVQAHPGSGRSTQHVSLTHAGLVLPYSSGYGKRSAPTTYIGHGNNVQVSAYGNELASGYAVSQAHPGYSRSFQQVNKLHSGHRYGVYGYFH